MNEQIKELAHKAEFINKRHNGDEWRWGYIDPELSVKLEKFAELIVRECAVPMITQARAMDAHGGYKNNPVEVTAMNLHQGLLKHFGVEE